MELLTDEKKMLRENIALVKRSIDFASHAWAGIERELKPEYGNSSLTGGFKIVGDRIGFLKMGYNNILHEFEKIEGFYPIDKRKNIQKKIDTVKKALESLAVIEDDMDALRGKFQDLPTKLFN